jgi:hypothetical protein
MKNVSHGFYTSVCLKCFHLKCRPATLENKAWCSEEIFDGAVSLDHPFVVTERNCPEFDEGLDE